MTKLKVAYSFVYAVMLMVTGFATFFGGLFGIVALDTLLPAPPGLIPIAFILLLWWLGHLTYKAIRLLQATIKATWPTDSPHLRDNREMTWLFSFALAVAIVGRVLAWSNMGTLDRVLVVIMITIFSLFLTYLSWERHRLTAKLSCKHHHAEVTE